MKRNTRLTTLRQNHEAARLQLETAKYQRALRVMQKYDVVEPNKLRRNATREMSNEGDIYNMTRRMSGCNLGRDLERNYSPARGILHQMRVNVVGSLGKLNLTLPGGEEGTAYFNEVFAKDVDFRDDVDWSTHLQNGLISEVREGDFLTVVDDELIEDTGKILTWEADQIAPVSEAILKSEGYSGATQDNGILRDKYGRIIAFCVTGKRGLNVIDDPKDVTIFKRGVARLCRNPWRLNQGRGVPCLLTPAANFIDLYEILASELQSAKRTAKQYAYVKRENSATDFDNPTTGPEFLPENDGRTSTDVALDGANQTTHTARNYERLETFTGGLTDYLQPEDTVEFPKLDHPNASLAQFIEAVNGYSGSSMGIAMAYTRLRADSSYTAFRGDMIMTWVTFAWMQKHVERVIADWTAQRVLRWAERSREIGKLPKGWERAMSWSWPTMPSVDEAREAVAQSQLLKNGTLDYAKLLGPDWRAKFDALAEQLDYGRGKNLPLSVFEQKSGGAAPSESGKTEDEMPPKKEQDDE